MILLIDNYDSFTYNLVQMLEQMDQEVKVFRNDRIDIRGIEAHRPSALMVSPGPGTPDDSGVSIEAIHNLGSRIPVLGVCLGHQAIAAAYGAKVVRANRIMHGKTARFFTTAAVSIRICPIRLRLCVIIHLLYKRIHCPTVSRYVPGRRRKK